MRTPALISIALAALASGCGASTDASHASNHSIPFDAHWRFQKGDPDTGAAELAYSNLKNRLLVTADPFKSHPATQPSGPFTTTVPYAQPDFDDSGWRALDLPHDWAIEGPFDQKLSGSTGKLPYTGVGWYRKTCTLSAEQAAKHTELELDGAMSYSEVFLNGQLMGGWPYGYASYSVDLTPALRPGQNTLAIRLQNNARSSRWYPGAGLYRHVHVRQTGDVRLAHWGTYITTPQVSADAATVIVRSDVEGMLRAGATLRTTLYEVRDAGPRKVATLTEGLTGPRAQQAFQIPRPRLWDVDAPNLYSAKVELLGKDGTVLDAQESTFGIRSIEFTVHDGFHLNGRRVQLNGVCDHHDLGALGSAVNYRATERQLEMLKQMGCNALRTSHNPPSPEMMELCAKMGILVMCEAFDCWRGGKTPGDYHLVFDDWHEADVRSMVRHYRNNPSVILWSMGNEIPDETRPLGAQLAAELSSLAHLEDPTRLTVCGSNHGVGAFNGYARALGVFGINYFTSDVEKYRDANPNQPVLYSESASTISSRGEYFFGAGRNDWMQDYQVSSDDLRYPGWASTPDRVFKSLDTHPDLAGEFVWTGWDYLGEPTPYDSDPMNPRRNADAEARAREAKIPSRSSYFGIIDLAGFPKDRFYLYQARWRPEFPMAHIAMHWTWPGRENQPTPVQIYTSGDEAELFLNGRSLGRKKKADHEYRLTWPDVPYQPGELRVTAYRNGREWARDAVRTAGAASRLSVTPDRVTLHADGEDLSFISVTLVDAKGEPVPQGKNEITFEVTSGPANVIATDAGDATNHESFQRPQIAAYNGKAMAIIRTHKDEPGEITVKVSTPGTDPVVAHLVAK